MQIRTIIVTAVVLLTLSASAFAQKTAKVCFIDIERIFIALSKEQAIEKELQGTIGEARKKIERKVSEINQLKRKIASGTTLSDTRINEIKLEVEEREQELNQLVAEQERILLEKEDEVTQRMLVQIQEAAERIARQKKYSIVIDRKEVGIIFAEEEFDITEDVIKYLEQRAQERTER